jgi:hypothetical protein
MAIVFNSLFGSAQSKTAGSSLTMDPTDITVAAGDDIFYAFASDDAGSAFAVSLVFGTASITWTLEKEQINAGNVKSQLWRGNVTAGGTVGRIDNNWTGSITAKAAVAGWYSGVGTQDGTAGGTVTGGSVTVMQHSLVAAHTNDLIVGAGGWEGPNSDALSFFNSGYDLSSSAEVGQNGTTGGGDAGNISTNLIYAILSADSNGTDVLSSTNDNTRDAAGAGAVYSPAPATVTIPEVVMAPYQAA